MKSATLVILLFLQTNFYACLKVNSCNSEISNSMFSIYNAEYHRGYNSIIINDELQVYRRILTAQPDSIAELYDGNRRLRGTIVYNQDQTIIRTYYRRNSKPELIISERNGVLHGKRESFYINGSLKISQYYQNGNPSGIWREWDRKGRIIIETDFSSDTIITKYHDYKFGKHTMLIRCVDTKTNKTIKKEKVVVQDLELKI